MSLFNISTITAAAPMIETDGYKFTTSKEVFISLGDIFHSLASSTNKDELKALFVFI